VYHLLRLKDARVRRAASGFDGPGLIANDPDHNQLVDVSYFAQTPGAGISRKLPQNSKAFCAVLARISDDRHRASDEQPERVSIALLRDPAEPLFVSGRMLSRHQADPCGKTALRLVCRAVCGKSEPPLANYLT
jgi:hypothetical protein